jgi:hypothetical protein
MSAFSNIQTNSGESPIIPLKVRVLPDSPFIPKDLLQFSSSTQKRNCRDFCRDFLSLLRFRLMICGQRCIMGKHNVSAVEMKLANGVVLAPGDHVIIRTARWPHAEGRYKGQSAANGKLVVSVQDGTYHQTRLYLDKHQVQRIERQGVRT